MSRAEREATRASYIGVGLGTLLAAGLFALVLSLPKVYSVRSLVQAEVVSQRSEGNSVPVRGEPIEGGRTAPGKPATNSAPESNQNAETRIVTQASQSRSPEEAGFDKLAGFKFEVTEQMVLGADSSASQQVSEQIPETVKALNEKRVAVRGFMLPTKANHGLATEFLLLRNQGMCCYGTVPKMNEWVSVRAPGEGVKAVMDRPLTVVGVLRVGEIREDKFLAGIYHLQAERVDYP